jgi:hypothetical protein
MSNNVLASNFVFSSEIEAKNFTHVFSEFASDPVRKSNFDGNAATWIVLADLAISALPHILTYLKDRKAGAITTVVVPGMIEINNASPEQIAAALELAKTKL